MVHAHVCYCRFSNKTILNCSQKKKTFFKQIAVAHSIFTLDGGFQLFCAAFDMPMTGVPLEVALGWQKFYFWAFQKNNHASICPL